MTADVSLVDCAKATGEQLAREANTHNLINLLPPRMLIFLPGITIYHPGRLLARIDLALGACDSDPNGQPQGLSCSDGLRVSQN